MSGGLWFHQAELDVVLAHQSFREGVDELSAAHVLTEHEVVAVVHRTEAGAASKIALVGDVSQALPFPGRVAGYDDAICSLHEVEQFADGSFVALQHFIVRHLRQQAHGPQAVDGLALTAHYRVADFFDVVRSGVIRDLTGVHASANGIFRLWNFNEINDAGQWLRRSSLHDELPYVVDLLRIAKPHGCAGLLAGRGPSSWSQCCDVS